MKLIFILSFFISFTASAQSSKPQISNRSSAAITVQDANLWAKNSFRGPVYQDTSSINLASILDSCGIIIYTRAQDSYWYRSCIPSKHWKQIGSAAIDSNIYINEYVSEDSIYLIKCSLKNCDSTYYIAGGGSGGGGSSIIDTALIRSIVTDSSNWVKNGTNIYNKNTGNVGFNKSLPTEKVDVVGNINISSGNAYKYNSVNIIRAQTALENVFFGNSGNLTMTGLRNTATGYNSLILNTTGAANTATGAVALGSNTTGYNNVANGHGALYNNIGGYNNVAIGHNALISNTDGFTNIAVGKDALQLNTNGYQNIAIGFQALQLNTSGVQNVAVGQDALKNNLTSNSNTAIGYQALYEMVSGDGHNVAIGKLTGRWVTTGINNTFIGSRIAFSLEPTISNNIAIATGDGVIKIRTTSDGVTSLYHGANVASASTIAATGNSFHVTGTTGITNISGSVLTAGATITLIFDGALTLTDGSNLKLNGDFVTTADDTITLLFDGTNFYEKGRSIN